MVVLFAACAALPLVALALVSYPLVTGELIERSRETLQAATRATGMTAVERLQLANLELSAVTNALTPPRLAVRSSTFHAVVVFDGGDRPLVSGAAEPELIDSLPDVAARLGTWLQGGAAALGRVGDQLVMGRPTGLADGTAWGILHPASLWLDAAGDPLLDADLEACVFDDTDRPLWCTADIASDPAGLRAAVPTRHTRGAREDFEWADANGRDYYGAVWQAYLHPQFGPEAGTWSVMVLQPRADVLAPLRRFRRSFVLVFIVSLLAALLLATTQIRRRMRPIGELRHAAKRIAARDFTEAVEITTGDEIEDLATDIDAMRRSLGRQFETLTAFNAIDCSVLMALDSRILIDTVLRQAGTILPNDGVAVAVASGNNPQRGWEVAWRTGPHATDFGRTRVDPPSTVHQDLSDGSGPRLVTDLNRHGAYLSGLQAAGATQALVVPLHLRQQLGGAVAFGFHQPPALTDDDFALVGQLSDQVALALSTTRLVTELDDLNWGALTALARTIDAKSPWTRGHSERVTAIAVATARAMGLSPHEIDTLQRGGMLHDIGKIGVPNEILDKPERLTDEEFAIMQTHTVIGARILEPIHAYAESLPIVRSHHEWINGRGYPDGLGGEDIPMLARVLAVGDVYDAVTSDRPYRSGMARDRSVAIIREKRGQHLDPVAVDAFLDVVVETLVHPESLALLDTAS